LKPAVKRFSLFVIFAFVLLALWLKIFLPPLLTQRVEAWVAREWLTSLDTGKRHEWKSLLIPKEGGFLAERPAYGHLSSHVHTGVDLQNRYRGGPGEPVYAVAKGKVFDVRFQEQGTRITIQHFLPSGEVLYTSYIHVAEVRVKKGMRVDSQTVIARRFNRNELKKHGQFYNHLHFQVHKGKFVPEYTVTTRTKEEAEERFYDPKAIFYQHHQDVRPDWRQWIKEGRISFFELLWILI